MYRQGGRQFSRGGLGGGGGSGLGVGGGGGGGSQDPPRRRRFRGQYVRRRTPSGGGYRAGSFSDDRNDSSPPPMLNNRPPVSNDDRPYNNYQPQQQSERLVHPRGNQQRGMRHQNQQSSFYDNPYPRQSRNPNQHNNQNNNFDMSDSERQHSPQRGDNVPFASLRRVDELAKSFMGTKTDIDEIKSLFSKLSTEIDQVKNRVKELEFSCHQKPIQHNPAQSKEAGDSNVNNLTEKDKRRKAKILKQREKKAAKRAANLENASSQQGEQSQQKILNNNQENATNDENNQDTTSTAGQPAATGGPSKLNNRQRRERNLDPRKGRRDVRDKSANKRVPNKIINDDSTTQAAEPSSEERPEGDDAQNGKERVRVFRRKKQHFGRRGRRADSSERNSNDTSPQENRRRNNKQRTYPELSESALNDIVQTLKREFLNLERPVKEIKKTMNEKGPKVVYEFAVAILDHAMCDVTSLTKLSEIANSLHLLVVSDDNISEVDFQKCFYEALNDLSKREDEISIDAPRYLDTLGSVLGECIVLMSNKHKNQVKRFLNKCIESYCPKNKANLLANIMKEIAENQSDRFAKDIWDTAQLTWEGIYEGSDLEDFLQTKSVDFTTKTFSPEPRKSKKTSKELEKFADDVTSMVEKRCTPQALDEFVKELDLGPDERVEYLGTLIYAIVRGCLITVSGTYKLDSEALSQYSSLIAEHCKQVQGEQDAITLNALTALTKLWHHHNCPQDLFRTFLLALYNQGTVSYEALKEWLNSESLTNIPGIGAARLSSRRYIEDLAATQKSP